MSGHKWVHDVETGIHRLMFGKLVVGEVLPIAMTPIHGMKPRSNYFCIKYLHRVGKPAPYPVHFEFMADESDEQQLAEYKEFITLTAFAWLQDAGLRFQPVEPVPIDDPKVGT